MASIKDVANQRKANIKATGGFPPAKTKPLMSDDTKAIKIRQKYEDMEEGFSRGKK